MDRNRKVELLDLSGIISRHLEAETVMVENRVLQTNAQMEELEEALEELKARQDVVPEDEEHEGLALTIMESYGKAITHLTLSIAHLKHKRDVYNLGLASGRAAAQELNTFGNVIPGIPTTSD